MEWIRQHVATSLSLIAGLCLISGAVLIIERAPARPHNAQAWGGASGSLQDPQAYTPNAILSTTQPSYGASAPTFLPIAPSTEPGTVNTVADTDLASLLTQLSASSHISSAAGSSTVDTSFAYQFIPTGLIATTTPGTKRSAAQQALYEYGNEVGSYIQSYESRAGNVPQILKDQVEDRTDPQKGQAVKGIGSALIYIGTQMEKMQNVPSGAAGMHLALAKSYEDIGKKLQAIPDSQGDQAFIAAIQSYDAAADTFAKNYVALADYFSVSQVKFSAADPGSVFTFSGGGGF
jgi:hypothetical protein